jgi:hypothetical protein
MFPAGNRLFERSGSGWLEPTCRRAVFPPMRIREENCNMVLLAIATLFSVAIAGGATLLGFADNTPIRLAGQ